MLVLVLLAAWVRPEISFEKWPDKQRPILEVVQTIVVARGVGNIFFTLRGGSETYLTHLDSEVVFDVDWVFDNTGSARLTHIKLRLRSKHDTILPFRR